MDEILIEERDGAVAILTLNRPAVLNALNGALIEQLRETLDQLKGDASLRAVILTGSGERAFAAGADIGELAALETAAEGEAKARTGQHVTELIEALPVPVIAAVNGFALGGGCELAMACDIRHRQREREIRTTRGQPRRSAGLWRHPANDAFTRPRNGTLSVPNGRDDRRGGSAAHRSRAESRRRSASYLPEAKRIAALDRARKRHSP